MLSTIPFYGRFSDAFGFSIYAFEGTGLVLPIQEITRDRENYPKIVKYVFITVALMYISFGTVCVLAYGTDLNTPLITDQIPQTPMSWTIKILFCINLLVSQVLMLHPVHQTIESALYAGW